MDSERADLSSIATAVEDLRARVEVIAGRARDARRDDVATALNDVERALENAVRRLDNLVRR